MGTPSRDMEVVKTEMGVLSTAPYCYKQNNGYPHGAHGFQSAGYTAGFPYNHHEPNEYNAAYAAKHAYHEKMIPSGYTYPAHSGYSGYGYYGFQGRGGSVYGGDKGIGQAYGNGFPASYAKGYGSNQGTYHPHAQGY